MILIQKKGFSTDLKFSANQWDSLSL